MEFNILEVEQLRALYHQKNKELADALLSGAEWDELKDKRQEVTDLSIALHKKLQQIGKVSPAEFQIRREKNEQQKSSEEAQP